MSLSTLDSKQRLGSSQSPQSGEVAGLKLSWKPRRNVFSSSGSDIFLSRQPSDDLVTYESAELYPRQTHDYYSLIGVDGDSHSGEYKVLHPSSQHALGLDIGKDS